MKNIIKTFVLSLGFLLLVGCSDFITQDPRFQPEEKGIYTDPSRVEATLRGLYGFMKQSYHVQLGNMSFIGGKGYMTIDARGEDIENVTNNNVELMDVYRMEVSDNYSENTNFWVGAYQVVNKVNLFLEGIEFSKETEVIDQATYDQYKSEALFVRGLCFFYLNNIYGQPYAKDPANKAVLLRLSPERNLENNDFPQSTVAEVYEQILKDMSDENISKLMVKDTEEAKSPTYTQATRATQAAAYMLKMRVYMAMNKWEEVIKCGEAIEKYALVKDLTSLFKVPYYGEETIFSLPMNDNNIPNTQLSLAEYYNGRNNIFLVDYTSGIVSKTNYGLSDDVRISDLIRVIKTETESKETIITKRLSKFVDASGKLDWVPVFRYAETKLNLAEAYMSSGVPNSTKAKALLKEVRHRSLPADKDPLKIDDLSDVDLLQAIYNEKRLEFIGEGIRGFDITRRLETVSKGKDKVGNPVIVVKPGDAGYIWPIPISEKLLNNMIQ